MNKVVKVKPLALIVDANELIVKEKVQVIVNSLRSREYEVLSYRELCDGAWFTDITIPTSERVPIPIAVNGVFRYPFEHLEVHELEDHIAYLKLLTSSLREEEIRRVKRASQLVTDDDLSLIENVDEENIREVFKHMVCVLEKLIAIPKLRD